MEENIKQIINRLHVKGDQLKQYVNHHFDLIEIPTSNTTSQNLNATNRNIPLSYIFYGLGGIFLLGTFVTNAKLICLGLAGLSTYGGIRTSQMNNKKQVRNTYHIDLVEIKNKISRNLIDINKYVSNNWDILMEQTQKQIFDCIDKSNIGVTQKDEDLSKIMFHEVIDVSMSEITNNLISIEDMNSLHRLLDNVRHEFLSKISHAVEKQSAIYQSILV